MSAPPAPALPPPPGRLRALLDRARREAGNPTRILQVVYLAMPLVITLQRSLRGPRPINNFLIFTRSFTSLVRGEDLYALHPESHFDLFRYSPTFALAMGPFAAVPAWLGLLAWNLLNALALFTAVQRLPLEQRQRNFVHWFLFIELVTATANSQSNALIAALLLHAFVALERGGAWRAALWLALAGAIKPYALAGAVAGHLQRRTVALGLRVAAVGAGLAALPLLATSPAGLLAQYGSWGRQLASDHQAFAKLSVMGVLERWFAFTPDKAHVVLVGAALYGLALLRRGAFAERAFRLRVLCSTLVFVVIFNHMAESATYIIAVVGLAVWYVLAPRGPLERALMVAAWVLTVFSPFDLFPAFLRQHYVNPWLLKAVPCILLWARMQLELSTWRSPAPRAPAPPRAAAAEAPGP